jgi:hypothetical protein
VVSLVGKTRLHSFIVWVEASIQSHLINKNMTGTLRGTMEH